MSEKMQFSEGFVMTDEQKERLELRVRDLMNWLCKNGHPYMSILITQTSAELMESDSVTAKLESNEYIVD